MWSETKRNVETWENTRSRSCFEASHPEVSTVEFELSSQHFHSHRRHSLLCGEKQLKKSEQKSLHKNTWKVVTSVNPVNSPNTFQSYVSWWIHGVRFCNSAVNSEFLDSHVSDDCFKCRRRCRIIISFATFVLLIARHGENWKLKILLFAHVEEISQSVFECWLEFLFLQSSSTTICKFILKLIEFQNGSSEENRVSWLQRLFFILFQFAALSIKYSRNTGDMLVTNNEGVGINSNKSNNSLI